MDLPFAPSVAVDAIIALTLLEAAALLALRPRWALRALLPTLVAGLCLMLALRAALAGAAWPWLALPLLVAGTAHGVDLALRWRQPVEVERPAAAVAQHGTRGG